jgi:hypothetical protein
MAQRVDGLKYSASLPWQCPLFRLAHECLPYLGFLAFFMYLLAAIGRKVEVGVCFREPFTTTSPIP